MGHDRRKEASPLPKNAAGLLKQDDDLTVLVDEVWHTSKPDPEADRLRELLREAMENKVQQFNHTIEDTRQIFRWMDADNSGDLDPTEFRQAILSLGLLRCKHQVCACPDLSCRIISYCWLRLSAMCSRSLPDRCTTLFRLFILTMSCADQGAVRRGHRWTLERV